MLTYGSAPESEHDVSQISQNAQSSTENDKIEIIMVNEGSTHWENVSSKVCGIFIIFAAVGVSQDALQTGRDRANNRVRARRKSHDHGCEQHNRGDHSAEK